MSDITNLLYNGDFSKGNETWSGSGLTVSGGVATVTGDLLSNTYIPVANGRTYRLTFDIKFNTVVNSSFYIALRPCDNSHSVISIADTYKPWNGTDTTLASALKNGDTTVALTSGTNWKTYTYSRIGICDRLAWGYNRASYSQGWTTISGNTITLPSAWAGGSWAAGTKVAEFCDGSTYYYPWSASSANLPTEWRTITAEFNGGNSMRYSCQYFVFSTLGYSHNYSMRNIRIECISDYQECQIKDGDITPKIYKTGIVHTGKYNEVGMKIRYIRDTTNGSTANSNNHWCEFQVFNSVNENIAWGRPVTVSGSTFSNSVATDGIVNSSYIDPGAGEKTLLFDIGREELITKIKIWHYYPDGRTYNSNITQVSTDGTHWATIYNGKKAETSVGNEIILYPVYASFFDNGEIMAHEFIEC